MNSLRLLMNILQLLGCAVSAPEPLALAVSTGLPGLFQLNGGVLEGVLS